MVVGGSDILGGFGWWNDCCVGRRLCFCVCLFGLDEVGDDGSGLLFPV